MINDNNQNNNDDNNIINCSINKDSDNINDKVIIKAALIADK